MNVKSITIPKWLYKIAIIGTDGSYISTFGATVIAIGWLLGITKIVFSEKTEEL